jgi:hypothetical protein
MDMLEKSKRGGLVLARALAEAGKTLVLKFGSGRGCWWLNCR